MSPQCLATTKKSFLWLIQDAFPASPEAENKLKVTNEPLKHRYLDFNQLAFCDGQEAENEFKVTCESLMLSRLHPSHILGWSRGRKWVLSAWRPLETLLSGHHQSRILGMSRGRKWLLCAIRPLESYLYRLEIAAFSVGQEVENDFKVTSDN